MREIKFQGIYKPTNEKFIPHNINFNSKTVVGDFDGKISDWCHFFLEPSGYGDVWLRQYTGLKDANGREIYEGDILKRTVTVVMYGSGKPPEDIDEYMKVEYREDYAGFYIGERPLFAYVDNTRDVDTGSRCTKAEVIGNIYEDPQLLESAE